MALWMLGTLYKYLSSDDFKEDGVP